MQRRGVAARYMAVGMRSGKGRAKYQGPEDKEGGGLFSTMFAKSAVTFGGMVV